MELFRLLGTIAINNKDATKALDEVSEKGEQTESKLGKALSGIGKGALAVGKWVGTGMLAAGTAVAGVVTQSTQSYAQYEQLVGGVETLFKDSAGKVMEYANNAFQTAGMSANEYMTTVTSFSASLLQSLGGDTEKAADKADMAIRDMSDNANKMGTSMEMIQNAYNGFAKQNYTMLDNLKLGYGGTKEEMERLLADAEKLSGMEFDLSSYGDVVDAIHVIQTEMGITGTTASEASGTISGSAASVSASWQNLVTALADDNADLGAYVDTFVNSLSTAAQNMIPRIGQALKGVAELIKQIAPVIVAELPGILSQVLPLLITAATDLVNAVNEVLPSLLDMVVNTALPQLIAGIISVTQSLIAALPSLINTLASALPTLLPLLISGAVSLIVALAQSLPSIIQPIIDNLPLILESVITAVMTNLPILVQGLLTLVTALIPMIPDILNILLDSILFTFTSQWATTIVEMLPDLLVGIGLLIVEICKALPGLLLALVKAIFAPFIQIFTAITSIFDLLAPWFNDNVVQPIIGFFQNLWEGIKVVWDGICNAVSVAFELIGSIISAAFQIIMLPYMFIWENCKEYVFAAFEWIKEKISDAIEFIKPLVQAGFGFVKEKIITPILEAKDKAVEAFNNIKAQIQEKITSVKNKVSEIFGNVKSKISSTVDSIKSKVTSTFESVKEKMVSPIEKARSAIQGIVDKIKGLFSGMKLDFPNIKTPHFGITPKGWEIGDLLKGSIPKLKIDWYAKAMNNPMIMDEPTIFGYNGATGELMGGGEAGSEVVSGTDTLMNMIQGAVAAQNETLVYYLENLTALLAEYCPAVLEQMRHPIPAVIGREQAADALVDPINYRLGTIAAMKGRGR